MTEIVVDVPDVEPDNTVIVVEDSGNENDAVDAVVIEAVIEQSSEIAELNARVIAAEERAAIAEAKAEGAGAVAEIALDIATEEPEVVAEPEAEPEPHKEDEPPKSKTHPFFK